MDVRVLMLIDELEAGGTQRQIATMVRHLPAVGVRPSVAYFRNRTHLADEMEETGCSVIHVERRKKFDATFAGRIAKVIRGERADVAHAFGLSAEFWGLIACFIGARHARLITSIRGRYEWYSGAQWRVKSAISRCSSLVIANSQAGLEYAAAHGGVALHKAVVVPNGLDLELFDIKARPGWPAELSDIPAGHRIVFVGRLVVHKNIPCLLKAMALIKDRGVMGTLCMIGDGPLRSSLERLARDLNLQSSVRWVGETADVAAILSAADCLVLPSHREGLSNAILEGMAASLPVVATAVGGNVELVKNGETGWLVADNDHIALAEKLMQLLSDGAMRRQFGESARNVVAASYSERTMVARMANIYRDVSIGRMV